SKEEYRRKNADNQDTKSESQFLYVYRSPDDSTAGQSTIEEHRQNSAQEIRRRNIQDTSYQLQGKSLTQLPDSYATTISRSSSKLRVGQHRNRKGAARRRRGHKESQLTDPISSRLRSSMFSKGTPRNFSMFCLHSPVNNTPL